MVAAVQGYRCILTMPESMSAERRRVLELLGAELVLTPAHERTDGAIREAHRILEEEPERYFMPNQFVNPDNWRSHYETTAPELIEQTGGEITAFVIPYFRAQTFAGREGRFRAPLPVDTDNAVYE